MLGLDRANDCSIWQYAKTHGFVLVTCDADFAEMATLFGPPPKVIWLRCGNQPTAVIEKRLCDYAEDLRAFDRDETAAFFEVY